MATVREGDRSVLLVVDVQVGVMREAWNAEAVVSSVARAVDRARSEAVPVLWVQHADDELVEGSQDWAWALPLAPKRDEFVVHKQYNSAFEETTLEAELARLGATHIVLSGAATNWCIRATAYGALDQGYDLTLVSDGHTTDTLELGDGSKIVASDVVRDLNATMAWLSYPGRSNTVSTAAELSFRQSS